MPETTTVEQEKSKARDLRDIRTQLKRIKQPGTEDIQEAAKAALKEASKKVLDKLWVAAVIPPFAVGIIGLHIYAFLASRQPDKLAEFNLFGSKILGAVALIVLDAIVLLLLIIIFIIIKLLIDFIQNPWKAVVALHGLGIGPLKVLWESFSQTK